MTLMTTRDMDKSKTNAMILIEDEVGRWSIINISSRHHNHHDRSWGLWWEEILTTVQSKCYDVDWRIGGYHWTILQSTSWSWHSSWSWYLNWRHNFQPISGNLKIFFVIDDDSSSRSLHHNQQHSIYLGIWNILQNSAIPSSRGRLPYIGYSISTLLVGRSMSPLIFPP